MPCHFEDHPTAPVTPAHSLVAIDWNRWSRSIGIGGHDQSEQVVAISRNAHIGANFSAVLVREVLYRSFANRRQLASYVGITPMPYQSGSMDRDRSISRAGNPRARTTLIQLAWLWLRYQPGSVLATWFRERVGTMQGRTRRIAIVAMARKLLIALWRYVETGVVPAGIEFSTAAEAKG